MDENLARMTFVGIMSIGGLVWLWSLHLVLRMGQSSAPVDWPTAEDLTDQSIATESGSRTVRGNPETLSSALARLLMQAERWHVQLAVRDH